LLVPKLSSSFFHNYKARILATPSPLTMPPIAKNMIAIKATEVAAKTGRFFFSKIESP
jgi:hypothetical protein